MFDGRGRRQPVEIDRAPQHVGEGCHDRLAAEQTLAAEHFPQHDAVGPDVGARSTGAPAACSGLMYAAVPRIIPACVIACAP